MSIKVETLFEFWNGGLSFYIQRTRLELLVSLTNASEKTLNGFVLPLRIHCNIYFWQWKGNFCWRWKPRKGQWLDKTHHLPCTRRKHSSSVDGRGRHRGMVWNNWLHYSNRLATDETYGNATAIFIVDWIPRILMTRSGLSQKCRLETIVSAPGTQ